MIALLQRVTESSVHVDEVCVGRIGVGLLVFLAVQRDDSEATASRLAQRVLSYRIFPDEHGLMNKDVRDSGGGVLIVPQFTLAADTRKGTRPGFSKAAEPEAGQTLFEYFVNECRTRHAPIEVGRFAARMRVSLVNDGPATFWLEVRPS
jgi:D-tyrosyl-tRNA(Tyr) deacylase